MIGREEELPPEHLAFWKTLTDSMGMFTMVLRRQHAALSDERTIKCRHRCRTHRTKDHPRIRRTSLRNRTPRPTVRSYHHFGLAKNRPDSR
jgi:hypothetical protein